MPDDDAPNYIAEAIEMMYGPPPPEDAEDCDCPRCLAWAQYDYVMEAAARYSEHYADKPEWLN